MCILHPAEWTNLRKYALQTYPGEDCESMRAAKINTIPVWFGWGPGGPGIAVFTALRP